MPAIVCADPIPPSSLPPRFDGYRFDGVTSMMYHHHGLQYAFTGNYGEYFGMNTDVDAVVYLMLVNNVLHDMFPNCITVGESAATSETRRVGNGKARSPCRSLFLSLARAHTVHLEALFPAPARARAAKRQQWPSVPPPTHTPAPTPLCRRGRVGHAHLLPALAGGRRGL